MSDVQALYFKVNLGLTTHQRFARVTPPVTRDVAVTVWLSVLDYTRTHELDGHCPRCVVQQPHREEAIAELLRVGLLTAYEKDGEHWLYLVNYERFNDTKAKIDARRQGANARKSKQRSKDVTPPVTRDIQRDGRVSHTLGHASVTSSETETETNKREREISARLAGLSTGIGATVEPVTPLADESHRERAREQITKLAEWAKANGVER